MSEEVEVAPVGYLPLHYRRIRISSNGVSALADKEEARRSGDEPRDQSFPGVVGDEEAQTTTESWGELLDAMREFDRETIKHWREDMNIMLMFSGLLSIAVSIFTVNAQGLLDQDPEEESVRLLSLIVTLLASPDPSTVIPAVENPPSFSPPEVAVKINTLWIISLTLSLVVAFFAITIQQWLRRVPMLQQLSVRECVRQRQFRYLGLRSWQVHTIISFLPTVLQVAVILFLVGLVYLLQALNHSVLLAYAIVAGIALLLYLVSAILPAILPKSPYKSLFLPTILAIVRAVAVPLVLLLLGMLMAFTYILGPLFSLIRIALSYISGGKWGTYKIVGAIVSFRTTLKGWVRWWTSFTTSDFIDLEQFWTSRERSAMWTPPRAARLDSAALAWAPCAMPQLDLPHVSPCFADLHQAQRTRAALEWAGLHLGNFAWHDMHDYSQYCVVNPRMLPRVAADRGAFARQNRDFLLNALPKDWSADDYLKQDPAIAGILTLLFETVKVPGTQSLDEKQSEFLTTFTKLLTSIRDSQVRDQDADLPAVHFATAAARIPSSLLFQCCAMRKHSFHKQGALSAVRWANFQLSGAAALGTATQKRHLMNVLELVIGSSATALLALTQQPSLISDEETQPQCRIFLASLSRFLDSNKNDIRLTASVCAARPAGTVHVVFRDALVTLSTCLINLLENDYIPMGDNCPSGPLYGRILEVCRDEAAFDDAMPSLRQFYDILMNRRVPDIPMGTSTDVTPGHGQFLELHVDDTSEKTRSLPDIPE